MSILQKQMHRWGLDGKLVWGSEGQAVCEIQKETGKGVPNWRFVGIDGVPCTGLWPPLSVI